MNNIISMPSAIENHPGVAMPTLFKKIVPKIIIPTKPIKIREARPRRTNT